MVSKIQHYENWAYQSISKDPSSIYKVSTKELLLVRNSNHWVKLQVSITLDPCGKHNRISGHTVVYYLATEIWIRDDKSLSQRTRQRPHLRPAKILIWSWDTELHTQETCLEQKRKTTHLNKKRSHISARNLVEPPVKHKLLIFFLPS